MKIREFMVGSTIDADLIVKSSEIKKTKAGKPYLVMELYDGSDTIQANNWDWGNNPAIDRNTVLTVTAQVTEWAGNKQLNVKGQTVNTKLGVDAFAPKGNMNIDEYITKASMLINLIQHEELRHIVRNAFNDNSRLWATAPAAKGVHHAFVGGNLKHAVDTATKARAIAQLVPGCRVDLCVAGALLHDVGKLFTYELDGVAVDMTDEGSLMEHITMGIALLERYRTEANNDLIRLLQHIIASHHEKLEYGSPVIPRFIEAWIVAYADNLDAKLQTIIEANEKANPNSKLTEKVWVMDNRQMFTRHYLDTILGDEDEMEVM